MLQQIQLISDASIYQLTQDINNFELQSDFYENSEATNDITSQETTNDGRITLSIKRGYWSHGFCFICKRKTGSKPMKVLPIEVEIYIKRQILIPVGARSCSDHLSENNYVKDELLVTIPFVDESIGMTS
ncbi:unnamed protein product [Brachionus calyciflorus]|uniref:Uncharacterized protein n=1 Tax=Brachionus calyciflorus TaxID=104777 RepID=A0A813XJN0_9BILA|nr:unnamed protein product [Brachionus calyciflorus]